MNAAERVLIQKAKKGSLLREKQAEALRFNDLLDFSKYLEKRDQFVKNVISRNRRDHVDVPSRIIDQQPLPQPPSPPKEEKKAEAELEKKKGWFFW